MTLRKGSESELEITAVREYKLFGCPANHNALKYKCALIFASSRETFSLSFPSFLLGVTILLIYLPPFFLLLVFMPFQALCSVHCFVALCLVLLTG